MENICDPTNDYDFSQLKFVSPSAISSGVYFIRLLTNNKQSPFYIQTPKCSTKQGFIKSGKKFYADLLFEHENETLLNFLESLENYCQKQLFENRDRWFDSDLTIDEIESSFTPLTKLYKSGKFFSVRSQVPIRMGKCNLKIFDENENDVDMETINDTNRLITIIEVQGIRCSSRNFQIDLELKQVMLLNDVDIFEKCIFTRKTANTITKQNVDTEHLNNPVSNDNTNIVDKNELLENNDDVDITKDINITKDIDESNENINIENIIEDSNTEYTNSEVETNQNNAVTVETVESDDDPILENTNDDNLEKEVMELLLPNDEIVIEDTLEKNGNSLDELCEVDINVENDTDEIVIKNKNDIYYQMYKKAKRKAKIAKDLALTSYLQARQIKHNYLDEHPLSDEEEDDEDEEELKKIALDEI